jgi:hypothetical protein
MPPRILPKTFSKKVHALSAAVAKFSPWTFQTKNKEISMTTTLTIGRRLVPLEHILLVEPFDPFTQTRMQSDRPFQTRVVLLDRESVLAQDALTPSLIPMAFDG